MPKRPTPAQPRDIIHDSECHTACPTIELVGRRWNSAILLALRNSATRFSQILATVDGLSDRMLALRLKELERAELISRTVEPTTPVSVHYNLTDRGRELVTALQPLIAYGYRWDPRSDSKTQHDK